MLNSRSSLIFTYCVYGIPLIVLFLFDVIVPSRDSIIAINSIHTAAFDRFLSSVTNLGHGIVLLPAAVLLLFRGLHYTIGLIISNSIDGIIVTFLKRIVFPDVMRPISSLDLSKVHLVPGVNVHHLMSFPSGHSVTAFGVCIFMSLCFQNKPLTVFCAIVACLVGMSRVYLLQHYLTDVIGGAFLGTIMGITFYILFEHIDKPAWMKQRLEIQLKPGSGRPRFS